MTLNLLYGIILGACLFGIYNEITKPKQTRMSWHNPDQADPIIATHHALTATLNFPTEKVFLTKDKKKLYVCYGHTSVVSLTHVESGTIGVGVGMDRTILTRTEEQIQEEFNDIKEIVESCGFEGDNFTRALAKLTAALAAANEKQFSEVSRQIPHDML